MNTRNAHDLISVQGAIDPQSVSAGFTVSSDWVDMSKFHQALFILMAGTIDTPVDFKLVEAKDTIGTGSKDLAGKAIVQAPITDDNRQYGISICEESLTKNSGYRYVRGVLTTGAGTSSILGVVALGVGPKQLPAIDNKHADYSQQID